MSNEIIKVLDDLSKRFGIAIDWSSTNIMPYLQDLMTRLVKYETYTSTMWLIIGIIVFIIGLYCIRKALKIAKSETIGNEPLMTIFIVLGVSSLVIGYISIFGEITDIIEVNTVPEKYIIEEIQSYRDSEEE